MKTIDTENLLIENGIKPTIQRLVIFDYLLNTELHPSADQVLENVDCLLPVPIARATVYNTLNLLVEKGLIKELTTEPGKVRYDAKHGFHHHFVDIKTGRVIDIDEKNLSIQSINLPDNYDVKSYQITFYGEIC